MISLKIKIKCDGYKCTNKTTQSVDVDDIQIDPKEWKLIFPFQWDDGWTKKTYLYSKEASYFCPEHSKND